MSRFTAMTRQSALPLPSQLAAPSALAERWRPGLAQDRQLANQPCHSEVFASVREASGAAVALALAVDTLMKAEPAPGAEAEDRRGVLWVQDKVALRMSGRPYRPGLPLALRHRLIHVSCDNAEDALFALEEGLRCREIAAVIGEIAGNPRALDFTASRRLTLTAQKHGVPLWVVRLDAARDLSSARMRWEVTAASSARPRWNTAAPGRPAWHAELFRARAHPPGTWTLRDEPDGLAAQPVAASEPPYPLGLAFAAGDRSLAAW